MNDLPVPTISKESFELFRQSLEKQQSGNKEGAFQLLASAIYADSRNTDAWNNMSQALNEGKRFDAAVGCLRVACDNFEDHGFYQTNLGNMLWKIREYDEADKYLSQAVINVPDFAAAHHNLGLLRLSQGRLEEAVTSIERGMELDPKNTAMPWDRSLVLLQMGDYERGWPAYEARIPYREQGIINMPMQFWGGEDLHGKTIYCFCEQGLGDSIMFSRFVPKLKDRGGRVVFDCQPELLRTFGWMGGVEVRPAGLPVPYADYHVPLASLPYKLGISKKDLPGRVPYLHSRREIPASFVKDPNAKFHVGICWAGSSIHENDKNRSASIELFLKLLKVKGVALYSLQVGPRRDDLSNTGAQILVRDVGVGLRDISDTAAVMKKLDLVIGVDTAVVHLAGALNVPCWTLINAVPDWRWQLGRDDTDWYGPSFKLYRQPNQGDWSSVMDKVVEDLRERVKR